MFAPYGSVYSQEDNSYVTSGYKLEDDGWFFTVGGYNNPGDEYSHDEFYFGDETEYDENGDRI